MRIGCVMASWIQADDDAGRARRGEQADAVLPHPFEGHKHGGERHHDDERVGDAQQDAHLRDVLARQQVVRRIQLEAPQVDPQP